MMVLRFHAGDHVIYHTKTDRRRRGWGREVQREDEEIKADNRTGVEEMTSEGQDVLCMCWNKNEKDKKARIA